MSQNIVIKKGAPPVVVAIVALGALAGGVLLGIGLFVAVGQMGFDVAAIASLPAGPTICVTTVFPGASPEDVEQAVTLKIEQALQAIAGLERTTASSTVGLSVVVARFQPIIPADTALMQVKSEVDRAGAGLPNSAEEPQVSEITPQRPALTVAVSGAADPDGLRREAEKLAMALEQTPGISEAVVVTGHHGPEIVIDVPPEILRRLGLTVEDIGRQVRNQATGLHVPGGVGGRDGEVLIRTAPDSRDGVRDLSEIVIVTRANGSPVRLKDIAEVRLARRPGKLVRIDGQRVVPIRAVGYRQLGRRGLAAKARQVVAECQKDAPEGVTLEVHDDLPRPVRETPGGGEDPWRSHVNY